MYCHCPHHISLLSAVTGNRVYRKQAIETGATYEDFFSAPTNKTKQKPNHCTTATMTTTEESFTTMLSDLCGLFKPCRKEIDV